MRCGRVLISGASVAGPALAVLLARAGWDVVVVEAARAPRTGGYAVDFRGAAHARAVAMLGVGDALRAVAVPSTRTRFAVGDRVVTELPPEFTGGGLNVLRRDLSRVLRETADPARVAWCYGVRVIAVQDADGPVVVGLSDGSRERVDLVVGADGIRSGVRRLVLGPDERFVRHLGHVVAGWSVALDEATVLDDDPALTLWNRPGRALGWSADPRRAGRAEAFAVFRAAGLERGLRGDREAQHGLLAERLHGVGPQAGRLLDAVPGSPEVYLDAIAKVVVPTFSRGRVVLVGDAAHGATLGGMGTGTALVGAAVLAHALTETADLDHALRRYDATVAPYAARCARGGASAGRFFAPRTALGITARNRFFATRLGRSMLLDTGEQRSEALDLAALGSVPRADHRSA